MFISRLQRLDYISVTQLLWVQSRRSKQHTQALPLKLLRYNRLSSTSLGIIRFDIGDIVRIMDFPFSRLNMEDFLSSRLNTQAVRGSFLTNHSYETWMREQVIERAIVEHDIDNFKLALRETKIERRLGDEHCEKLLIDIVRNNFGRALKIVLNEYGVDVGPAFSHACCTRRYDMLEIFLKDSCKQNRHFVEFIFELLESDLVQIAVEYIDMDGFNLDDQEYCLSGQYFKSRNWRTGQSSLHVACLLNASTIVEKLLQRGAKMNLVDSEGYNALFYACLNGNFECALILVRHGVKVSQRTELSQGTEDLHERNTPRSPLYAACCLSTTPDENDRIVRLLLFAGIDLDVETWIYNNTAEMYISEDVCNSIKFQHENPVTLERLCTHAVLKRLRSSCRNKSVLSRLICLPLPAFIKEKCFLITRV